jgi:hypothetical protein
MKNLFARRTPPPERAGDIKVWVSKHLKLGEDDLVTVAELACHEPGCPPIESVITVYSDDGGRRSWHIHKSLAELERSHIVTALV